MKIRRALLGFALLTLAYLAALVWVDSRNPVAADVTRLWHALPLMLAASLTSYFVRFCRWHWLLVRSGHRLGFGKGFAAYLSGFALTASPGKVGELIRIRYLAPAGVPPWQVLSAFVFERAADLLAVLLLASLFISSMKVFLFAAGFVMVFLGLVILAATRPALLHRIPALLRAWRARRLSRMARTLREGLAGSRIWANPLDITVALLLGLLAWSLTSLSFVYLLQQLDIQLAFLPAISTYPMAMLAGAASMIPGGLASTEATIVITLLAHGVDAGGAALSAICIRLTTLWFAIICGLLSIAVLEPNLKRR